MSQAGLKCPKYDKCLVLGASEVCRLARCMENAQIPDIKPNFGFDQIEVRLHGLGGRTVAQLDIFDLHMVDEFKPQVILLRLGGNDLSHDRPTGAPEVVGCSIVELAEHLRTQYDVQRVIVSALNPRYFPFCGKKYPSDYNKRVSICNQYLLHTWNHPDVLKWDSAKIFCHDGVHFSMPTGTKR